MCTKYNVTKLQRVKIWLKAAMPAHEINNEQTASKNEKDHYEIIN